MSSTISRRAIILAGTASIAIALSGCGDDGTSPAASGAGPTKVTIQIDGAAVPYYAPLYMAKENGYFKQQGLEVEFIYADASTVLKNVAAGNVQLGFPNGDAVIAAAANGVPVKVVHSTYQQGIGALLSLAPKGITNPADLKGRTVGVTSLGSPNYVQLQVMAANVGLDVKKDMKVKTVGTSTIVDALKSGEVDAIVFSRLRYYALVSSGLKVNQILTNEYLPSYGNVLVTSSSYLKDNPDVVKKFIAAFDHSIQDIIDGGAKEAVDTSVQKYAPDFKGQEAGVTKILEDVFVKDLWQSAQTQANGLGYSDIARWQKAADIQHQYGAITKDVKAETFVADPGTLGR